MEISHLNLLIDWDLRACENCEQADVRDHGNPL